MIQEIFFDLQTERDQLRRRVDALADDAWDIYYEGDAG